MLYMSQVCDVCFYGFLLCNKNFRTFVKMFLKSSFFFVLFDYFKHIRRIY